ncbi:Protein SDS23 [Trichoderma ghanense]|uniref:Protein SDS23 n=1 Tax=Trichoderma ghanense TaxID=65468 RepID=A0ABY2H5P9_9HYPO
MSINTEADKSAKLSEPKASPSPQRSPSSSSISKASHRQSFTENLRNPPASPRHRHPSLTHAAIQDLLIHPASTNRHQNSKFAGREWRDITVGELTSPDDVRWIDIESSVEEATLMLLQSPTGVVLVREGAHAAVPIFCFDYNDLNAYLLTVVGVSRPEGDQATLFHDIMTKAQGGAHIPLGEIQPLCSREAIVKMNSNVNLSQAIETLGSGIHRLLVTDSAGNVIGIISQLRMVEFFWNEAVNFPTIDRLNPVTLQDLGIGVRPVLSVHSDAPLTEALSLMYEEGLSSVAIVDSGHNVVGNISTKDVRHLTSSSSAYLLGSSCMHFISVILNERGVEKGQDVYPVFYVTPYSTLGHTIAKLVATKSHRMWIVESAPQSSPLSTPATPTTTSQTSLSSGTVPAPTMAGALLSGKLIGVVSLTDILNIFAKSTGLHPSEPGEQRARRRRSSSSSVRPSVESLRSSVESRR